MTDPGSITPAPEWLRIDPMLLEPGPSSGNHQIITLELAGKSICITRHNGSYFAFTSKCPHAGVSLSDGWIDEKGQVVCPRHEYKFSLKNGYNISEGYFLKTYPVQEREDGLYIRL